MGSEKFIENYGYLDRGLEVLDRILIAWDTCDSAFTEVSEEARKTMRGDIAHLMLSGVKSTGDKKMIHRALLGIAEMLEATRSVEEVEFLH